MLWAFEYLHILDILDSDELGNIGQDVDALDQRRKYDNHFSVFLPPFRMSQIGNVPSQQIYMLSQKYKMRHSFA